MATNLAIDDKILTTAQGIAGITTKKDTFNLALKEFIQRRKPEEIIDHVGTVDFDNRYDSNRLRSR